GHQIGCHDATGSDPSHGTGCSQLQRVSCFARAADDDDAADGHRTLSSDRHVTALEQTDAGNLQVTDVVHNHVAAVQLADGDLEVAGIVHNNDAAVVRCRETANLVITAKVEPTSAISHQTRRCNPAGSYLCNSPGGSQFHRV